MDRYDRRRYGTLPARYGPERHDRRYDAAYPPPGFSRHPFPEPSPARHGADPLRARYGSRGRPSPAWPSSGPSGPRAADGRSIHDPAAEDEEIRSAVRRALLEDAWLDAEMIEIRVEDGVVTLTGEVGDYLEARYAWDDAWEVAGVRGVVSRIDVRGSGAGPSGVAAAEDGGQG
jgi:hypothetical protein